MPIEDIEMYHETRGTGEPLLLVHGFTGSGGDWNLIFPTPPDDFQLLQPDLRGHGRSSNPSGEFTFWQSAHDVFALLDRLGIRTCKAIGVSGGGQTLLHMATQQPSRLVGLVLVSTSHYFPAEARAIMRQMTVETRSEADWAIMRRSHLHGDEQIRALWRQANALQHSYTDVNFTPPLLSTITAPTLIVHGDRDPLYPLRIPLELHASIPHSHLWVLPNARHSPIWDPRVTGRFVDAALAFLRDE